MADAADADKGAHRLVHDSRVTSRRRRCATTLWLALLLAAITARPDPAAGDEAAVPWLTLAAGLELTAFKVGQASVLVLRSDPERWETVALAVTANGGEPRSARAWGEQHGLVAVINAGMYDIDRRTHMGYFRIDEHVNSGAWTTRRYQQAACFEPREPGLPRFVLMDLDRHEPADFADRYRIVVQNLRLIRKPRENRWFDVTRPWSEACLGEDGQGRQLWIYCRQPHVMRDFNEILLALPIDLVAAQHLEGGVQAQLWVALTDLLGSGGVSALPAEWPTGQLTGAGWPVPNVLGLRARSTP